MSGKPEVGAKVNFPGVTEEESPLRKRHLTARYDKKTRRNMKEKLNLEDYIFSELRRLYKKEVSLSLFIFGHISERRLRL